jgi:hypothetical protein
LRNCLKIDQESTFRTIDAAPTIETRDSTTLLIIDINLLLSLSFTERKGMKVDRASDVRVGRIIHHIMNGEDVIDGNLDPVLHDHATVVDEKGGKVSYLDKTHGKKTHTIYG